MEKLVLKNSIAKRKRNRSNRGKNKKLNLKKKGRNMRRRGKVVLEKARRITTNHFVNFVSMSMN
jgi:hypothetical protein